MIPVTGAGWSHVSGVGGETEGASTTATGDRIVVPRASADGSAGARGETGGTHGSREPLGVIAVGGDAEHRAAAAGHVPVDPGDDRPSAPYGVSQGGVGSAGGRLEGAAHQSAGGRLAGFEEQREPCGAPVVTDLVSSH